METIKTYTIGKDSRLLLDVLNTYETFRCQFLDALTELYGEKDGEQLAASHSEQLEDVERLIMEFLRVQLTQEMGTGKTEITI